MERFDPTVEVINPYSRRESKEIEDFYEPWHKEVEKAYHSKMWQVSKNVCIYRVPKCIRMNKEADYHPYGMSFGPYHNKEDRRLSRMDQYKIEAIQRMSERIQRMLMRSNIDVSMLIGKVQNLDGEIRKCYAEPIEWSEETLAWMFTMDACFILESIRGLDKKRSRDDVKRFSLVFQHRDINNAISALTASDVIKLENQIPKLILTTLLEIEFPTGHDAIAVLADCLNNVGLFRGDPFMSSLSLINSQGKLLEKLQKKPLHLLDLYRMVVIDLLSHSTECRIDIASPSTRSGSSPTLSPQPVQDSRSTPCAQYLQVAGIKFKPGNLRFEKKWFGSSTLYLPPIFVNEYTELALRNLTAYEECQRCSSSPEQTVISQYVYLFDDLIDSQEDVAILKKAQVIVSVAVSENHIAQMFNNIQRGITFDPINEIEAVMTDVRKHYKSRWYVWQTQFMVEYFSKPWYSVPLVMGLLGLVLTFMQTVYSARA